MGEVGQAGVSDTRMSAPRDCCGAEEEEQGSKSRKGTRGRRRPEEGRLRNVLSFWFDPSYLQDSLLPYLSFSLLTSGLLLCAFETSPLRPINPHALGLGPLRPSGLGHGIMVSWVRAADTIAAD
jgi:hypothetical protein